MSTSMRWLLVSILLLSASALAQKQRAWPIETLGVEGNRNYTTEQILRVAGLRIGQTAGEAEFEAARKRLLDAGVFETVGYRYDPAPGGKGLNAKFMVAEIAQVYLVRFENLNASPADLERYLLSIDPLFSKKVPGTKQILERYAKALETHLKAGAVVGVLTPEGPDQLVAVFRPSGAPPVIAEVDFRGNQVIATDVLRAALAKVAIGAPYNENRMREILDFSIRPLYEARGRVRVAFPKIEAARAKDVSGVAVVVDVAEGEVYQLREVKLAGSRMSEEELRKAAAFKLDDVANFDEINAGIERINQRLRRNGFMKAAVKTDRSIDDIKKVVDLSIKIEDGPQYTFRKLELKGLDIHGEAAIRKLWALKPEKPFDAGYPAFFLDRIREDGLFDNLGSTKQQIIMDESNRTVDVILTFGGAKLEPVKKTP